MTENKAGRKKDIDTGLWRNSQGWMERIGENDSHFSGNPAVFKREDPWLSVPTSQWVWLFSRNKTGKAFGARYMHLSLIPILGELYCQDKSILPKPQKESLRDSRIYSFFDKMIGPIRVTTVSRGDNIYRTDRVGAVSVVAGRDERRQPWPVFWAYKTLYITIAGKSEIVMGHTGLIKTHDENTRDLDFSGFPWCLVYVGIAGFAKNMGTTISGMTAQYRKSIVIGFENRLTSPGLTLPQRKAARGIVLWDGNYLTEE